MIIGNAAPAAASRSLSAGGSANGPQRVAGSSQIWITVSAFGVGRRAPGGRRDHLSVVCSPIIFATATPITTRTTSNSSSFFIRRLLGGVPRNSMRSLRLRARSRSPSRHRVLRPSTTRSQLDECWRIGKWTSTGGWRIVDGSPDGRPFPPSVWDELHPGERGEVIETCAGYTDRARRGSRPFGS